MAIPLESPLRTAALFTLLLPYLVSGVSKLVRFDVARTEVQVLTGVRSATLTLAVIATQLGGSALMLSGAPWNTLGGAALAGFTLVATFLAHRWWQLLPGPEREQAFNGFWEHLALVGALVYAALPSAELAR